jgi:formamidopyrimidine-DNA glycosylase
VGKNDGDLPKSWLFHHRWERGRNCPIHGSPLERADIGGRTTCWCPICQKRPIGV